ncbi:hypothetical protein HF670_12000 [Acidithiobacillus thiooxidans]|uniref:hypothetical protein n=1 Tax=Acidithiobacillus thiooxidans TaxID=930 RepID=UPI001C066967|nr:hypothetical protein [Acidithiobacillus thiooxidans]MBU2840269.1 hypothetical protein [Acidithiobacillus thiooxidans]MBU2844097.1 hypothetical protein [Acidithiobacillus thiooxidans]
MDRVLVSVSINENPEMVLRSEQILCRIMLQAPAGTFLKRSKSALSLVIPAPDSQRHSVSLWDELPQSNPQKLHFDFDDAGHSVLPRTISKGMSR